MEALMENIKMIKVERTERMERAIARCKANHPKVRRVDSQTVTVYGSIGDACTVRFAEPRAGLTLAACNCPAGLESKVCYHLAAAPAAPVAPMAAQPAAEERESLWHSGQRGQRGN
jgi:hypothetical protein